MAQAGSEFGWWWAAFVVDGARARWSQRRTKDGAVVRGVIFNSNSSFACNKASFRSSSSLPDAQSNSSLYKKFLMRSHRSDMTAERFVYKNVYSRVT